MSRPTARDRLIMLARRKNVASLYLRGESQWAIAGQCGVNQATISRDLKAIRAEWTNSALFDFEQVKAQQLAEVDEVEREAWAAWRRSQQNVETTRVKKAGERNEAEKVSKAQAGEPRFLAVVLDCVKRRCEILGVQGATKHEHSGLEGKPIHHAVVKLNPEGLFEEMREYLPVFQKLAAERLAMQTKKTQDDSAIPSASEASDVARDGADKAEGSDHRDP